MAVLGGSMRDLRHLSLAIAHRFYRAEPQSCRRLIARVGRHPRGRGMEYHGVDDIPVVVNLEVEHQLVHLTAQEAN